ncbi:MAG: DNA polymerase III subunit delta [Eubacteriales bacterium]|nr:DNA polymerase III subunit delta [Eubacteriales bacterium]
MKEITKNIKEKQFHKVYLITGDEDYLIFQARQMLKNALVAEGDEMNFTLFEETKVDLVALGDLASTFPFFSEKRVILLNRTNIMKTGKDEFLKILNQLPDTTCLIICEPGKMDTRTKVYKWIKSNGYIAELLKKDQKEKTLLTFLARTLAKDQKQIRENNARYFLSLVGDDYYQIKNEAEKLISYLGEETEVTREVIDAVVTEQIQNKIFDMISAVAEKDQNLALKLYNDLILLKEDPIYILSLLVRQYRILSILKPMRMARRSDADMAKAAGVPPFVIRKYDVQMRAYTKEQLERCLRYAVKMEADIKMGLLGAQVGVEMLLITLIRS